MRPAGARLDLDPRPGKDPRKALRLVDAGGVFARRTYSNASQKDLSKDAPNPAMGPAFAGSGTKHIDSNLAPPTKYPPVIKEIHIMMETGARGGEGGGGG
jgi:hypothetical protein